MDSTIITEAEIEHDLSDVAAWLREQDPKYVLPAANRFYSYGTRKPYEPGASHGEMVRKAQASWSLEDVEV